MSQTLPSLKGVDVKGKKVLLRVDLNVPAENGEVRDATRLARIAPTLRFLAQSGAQTILLSHFGRPDGQANPAYSLDFLQKPLAELAGTRITFVADLLGPLARGAVSCMHDGDIILLENLRFHPGEESNDLSFARALAEMGDLYVNDAFSVSHRAHASVEALAHLLPCYAGFAMEAELNALNSALSTPTRPVLAVVGGSKISTKLAVLNHLVAKVDMLAIGGAMAHTFLLASGYSVGKSLREADLVETAQHVLATAKEQGCRIILPVDVVTAHELTANVDTRICDIAAIGADDMALDIGPKTLDHLFAAVHEARTLLWNGPLGAFEVPPFDKATMALAHKIGDLTKASQLVSIAGGGDTVAALEAAQVTDQLTYVSTAGGAFLEWLEGKSLPGIKALLGET